MRRDPTDHIGDSLATIAYSYQAFSFFEQVSTGAANNYTTDLANLRGQLTKNDFGNFVGKYYYAPVGIILRLTKARMTMTPSEDPRRF